MKFLADMGISPKTVALLRALGYDVTRLQEQGLERLPDPTIMTKALEEERILLTHDLGFGELMAASGARLPSVIIFRLRDMRPTHVNRHLSQLEKDDFGTHECFGNNTSSADPAGSEAPANAAQARPARTALRPSAGPGGNRLGGGVERRGVEAGSGGCVPALDRVRRL